MSSIHGLFHSSQDEDGYASVSIVVPVYNEKAVLNHCITRLNLVMKLLSLTYEIIFVDDGSTDDSGKWLVHRAREDGHMVVATLSRNYGKEAALTKGIELARYDAVVVIDADLQDPPELIPEMVAHWKQGVDIVLMKRRSRAGETWFKRASAHIFYRMLNKFSRFEIPADVGDFRLMSRRAVEALEQLPERNRYMKGLFAWVGFEQIILEYDRDSRVAGNTKWNYFSLLSLSIEAITSFSTAPLRISTVAGIMSAMVGGVFGIWIIFKTLVFGEAVQGYASLMAVMVFLGGVQLLMIGILGEYLGKTYLETKNRPNSIVKYLYRNTSNNFASRPVKTIAQAKSK